MVRAVIYGNFDVNHREACQNACFHSFFNTSFNRTDISLGIAPPTTCFQIRSLCPVPAE